MNNLKTARHNIVNVLEAILAPIRISFSGLILLISCSVILCSNNFTIAVTPFLLVLVAITVVIHFIAIFNLMCLALFH